MGNHCLWNEKSDIKNVLNYDFIINSVNLKNGFSSPFCEV